MKKKSPPYAIIGAVILGLIAVYAFVQHDKQLQQEKADELKKQQADLQAQIDALKANPNVTVTPTQTNMRGVIYATQPVDAGAAISPAFYETKLTPVDILPDAYTDKSDIVGWFAVRRIEKGDPLTPRNIGKTLPYMSQRIGLGMRAVSLPVFNAAGNATGGFIVDGDRVDLLYTYPDNSTQVIMQNLNVLFVPGPPIKTEKTDGVNPVPTPGETVAVTFEVTPEQAQALVFMSQKAGGNFSMILRSRRDDSEIKVKPFLAEDYNGNLKKIQTTTDKSILRVQELAAAIEAKEKTQGSTGNTNEITTPKPPSP